MEIPFILSPDSSSQNLCGGRKVVKNDKENTGIALVSGGMDSCVAAAFASRETSPAFLHVKYGQRTEAGEERYFRDIADYYNIPPERRLVVSLTHLSKIGGSALTDQNIPVPKHLSVPEKMDFAPATYVPFRNTHILSIAVSWAEVIGASAIYIGAVEEDSAGYPDCRPEYYEAFNRLIATGSYAGERLKVLTPLIDMTKTEIVKKGIELGAPLHLSWSCYERSEQACGRCDSCLRRLRAFREAGFEDRIPYVDH